MPHVLISSGGFLDIGCGACCSVFSVLRRSSNLTGDYFRYFVGLLSNSALQVGGAEVVSNSSDRARPSRFLDLKVFIFLSSS